MYLAGSFRQNTKRMLDKTSPHEGPQDDLPSNGRHGHSATPVCIKPVVVSGIHW